MSLRNRCSLAVVDQRLLVTERGCAELGAPFLDRRWRGEFADCVDDLVHGAAPGQDVVAAAGLDQLPGALDHDIRERRIDEARVAPSQLHDAIVGDRGPVPQTGPIPRVIEEGDLAVLGSERPGSQPS